MKGEGPPLFHEEQQFRQPWLWVLLGTVGLAQLAIFGYGMVSQLVFGRPWGDRPMGDLPLLIVGCSVLLTWVVLLLLFSAMGLVTEVRGDGLRLRFFPFHLRPLVFQPGELRSWVAVTYSPLWEYGGWGIRWSPKGKAYNVSGNRGVMLTFRDGRRLLVGSQKPEELAAALGRMDR
jgi:hypothetical protein